MNSCPECFGCPKEYLDCYVVSQEDGRHSTSKAALIRAGCTREGRVSTRHQTSGGLGWREFAVSTSARFFSAECGNCRTKLLTLLLLRKEIHPRYDQNTAAEARNGRSVATTRNDLTNPHCSKVYGTDKIFFNLVSEI